MWKQAIVYAEYEAKGKFIVKGLLELRINSKICWGKEHQPGKAQNCEIFNPLGVTVNS